MSDIVERLRSACKGHPHAKIEWPHRVLHEAADEIDRLRGKVKSYEGLYQASDRWVQTLEAENDRLQRELSGAIEALDDCLTRGG